MQRKHILKNEIKIKEIQNNLRGSNTTNNFAKQLRAQKFLEHIHRVKQTLNKNCFAMEHKVNPQKKRSATSFMRPSGASKKGFILGSLRPIPAVQEQRKISVLASFEKFKL